MAEAPKDRFRRLIKELAEDDRTFLDTNLLGIYRRGIDYGKAQGFFSDSEATTYRGVADQRIQAIRKVPVLDQQGQPITKTTDVPVMRDGKYTTIKRTTPLSAFDLQKKTGGQMEGGDINGPIYTGRSLGADANLNDVISQRVKLKEQIAPAIQANAREIEQKRGQSALYKPGTLMGLTAGALAAPFVGVAKDSRAAIMRGAGVSADQIAREVYTYKQPEIDSPFALGVEHAGIFGQTLEEGVLPSLIGTGAGILTGSAAGALAAPTAPFTAGLGPVAAAIAVGMPTAYFATDLAQKGQAAVKKAILGDDVYAARQRQMSEATSANKYGALAGQMAANFAVATPTLPSLSLLKGGLAAGKTGANIARAERALINAGINPKSIIPSAPLTGMAGRISNSKFYNFVDGTLEGAITSKAGQKFNLDVARGATRGFTRSAQGQEFMSDIAERGIEGMTDLRQAIAQREKDKLEGRPETPLYEIMAQTLFGSLFEGRGPAGKAFDFAGKVGGKIGEAGLRAVGDTTSPRFAPLGQLPESTKMPSKVTPGMPTGNVPAAGRPNATERLELPQNIIPMGRGRIAEINREGFTSTVKSVNDLPGDYLDIRMGKGPSDLDLRENVYNAVSRIAPDAGTFARVKEFVKGPAALKAEKVGDSFEQLAGFTDDGFAKISVIKPDGTSTYNTVSVDTLAPANQKKALSAMQEFGIKPSDTTGYVKADVQRDILKNFDLQTLSNPELKNNFQNEFWMGDTLVPGRIVSKVDENHVVMQLPSPTSGVDMIVVPNVNVERMGQPQTIYDTRTIPAYDPSNYSVDKEFHSPIRATSDRVTTKDLNHPMLLTPEQASRAERARSLIIDKKKDLVNAGESAKDIKAKADASIKAATNEMLASTRAEAEYAFDEGTLIEFVDASGQSRMGVVVDNSPYGPVVIDADAPTKPAFIVQESSILKTSVPMQKIRKAEAVVAPTTTEDNVARRTGRKRKATAVTPTPTPAVPDIVAESETDVTPTSPVTVKQRRKRTVNPVTSVTPVATEAVTEPRPVAAPEPTGFEVREMTPADIVADGSFVPDMALDAFSEAGVTLTPTQETMITEGDIEAVDEGSYLENVQPGDVTVADGDSLVRIRASIEGIGDINEVLAKARNRQELEVVLKDMLVRSGQVKGDADSTTAAKAVAAYYDEMIHAFVNRDLYVAQLVMQDVDAIFPVERKSQAESRQPLSPEPVSDNLSKAAKKIALRRNRAAALIQQYDMPRINSIMEAIDAEASSSATLYNQLSGEYFVPKGLTFEDITGDDARRSIIERVRMKMVADRYKTNIPVFKVIDAGPKLDSAYDNIFEKRGGYTTIVDERTNAGQQVVFVMANNSDIGTTVHEISHAILDNMPVHMASELATRFGKTLRKPTKLNESYIPYELHEMFATAMEQSFLSGTPPVSMRGLASGQARLNDIWGKISGFMQKAYSETYGFNDASGHVNWAANRLEWSVPYDNNNVFLWDGIPVTLQIDGKLVRAKVMKTKEKPKGPGLIPDSMINQPMVTVELFDPVSTAIATSDTSNKNAFGSTVVMPSEIISIGGITQGMSPKLGSMMVKWVSGYSTLTDSSTKVRTPIIGLRGTYTNTNDRLMKDNPSGLLDRITDSKDGVIPFVDKIIKLDKDGMERTSTEWKGYLLGLSNRTMSAANRALSYGLITNIPNDVSHTDYNQWINIVGSLRQGQFLKEYTYKDASGKTSKLNTLEWTRAGLKDLANTIESLEAYTGTMELQNRERQSNAQRGAGNTGGNVLYQSRRRGVDATLRKEAAQRIAGNSNPHSLTPEAFAHYATYDGVPRDVIKQFVDDRVITDAHRTFDGTADIRTLEINDVLIVDGTIDATDTLDSLKKALDFVQRNGIDNLLLHTQAGKTEPLGYSDKGYSVEPSITFTSTDAITDDIYSSIRKQYPAIRISPDRKSVTMTHLEERGKSYENSLEDFGKAIKQVTDKFIEADVPVQGIQSTERLWNFGNENGRGYAINYDEARNVLNISTPNLFGVDPKPKFDVTIRPTIEEALSAVRGKKVNLPAKFDMSVAPDTLERWTEAGNQFNKLPNTFMPNTDSKRVYSALIKELPKQFKFLELTVGFPDTRGASKVIIQPDTRVDPYNPLLQNSGITTIDGKPLKHSEVIDAIYQSIRANVQVVSGGEHSHNLAFAAHASITQDPMAIWGMWSETIGRSAYSTFSSKDTRKTGLPPLDAIKTGVVGVDKRIDSIYKDANNQFGHLKITDSNNSFSPATLASGRGVTLFSARKRGPQSWAENGGPKSQDFTTHDSPDDAVYALFDIDTTTRGWKLSDTVIDQLSNRNSPLFQMFDGNRDHLIEYLGEAVLAQVNITGDRRSGVKALEEVGLLDEGSRTANVTFGSYVKSYIRQLADITDVNGKPVVNPVNGNAKLYHASNALINITDGSLVSANTISRRNGNMDDTLVYRQGDNEGEGLGGTPAVVSLTYSFDYAVDIAKVASNLRNVLIDSKELDTWRSSSTRRVKLALTTKDSGKSFINDRIRRMSGIDNPSVPAEYKSMVEELINDSHGLDVLMLANARMEHPDELVANNYYDAIGEIETYLPDFRRRNPDAAANLSATLNWLANNKAPSSVKDTTGVNPVYAVAYAQWKSKVYTRDAINSLWENTKEMLDMGGAGRINAVQTLASVELNYEVLGLPATTIFPSSTAKLAGLSKEELMNRSIGILEYETDASKLFEHYEPEKEVRTYAPSSLGTPTAMYNPYGKPMEAPTTNTYKTLWSARPVKPPVIETTTVDDDGTVKVVRTQDPAETSSKVKDALKIAKWVTVPYGFVNDLARNSVGGDWSAILIQNWITANPIENPKLFAHQFMIGLKMMKPNLGFQKSDGTVINQNRMLGREEFHKLGDQLRGNQFYELGIEAGLTLNTHRIDERLAELRKKDPRATIMNVDELGVDKDLSPTHQLLKHQPLQGASERTMAMTKDYIKMMKFTQGMQHYIEIGYNPKSSKFTEVAKDFAGMLNVAQGDVKFSSDKEMDDLIGSNLRNLMFAPRWLASRFMFDPILRSVYTTFSPEKGTKLLELNRLYKRYGVIDPYVRAENNRLFMKSAGMFAFIGFLLSRFNPFGEHGTEVEVKGLGSSIRVGDYVFKAPGGVMYQMEIMSTLIGGLETKPGETSEERLSRTSDQIKMLIMSKAAPAVSLANDMITGRNIIGEPSRETYKPLESYWNAVTRPALLEMGIDLPAPKVSNLVADRLFYLWAQDAMDTYDAVSGRGGQYPGMEASAVGALAFLGGRVRYSPKELKWQYKANDNDNPVPGWEYTFTGVDEDKFFEEQARNVQ